MAIFIVDCPQCKAKVGAQQSAAVERSWYDDDAGEPFGERVMIGKCPRCTTILVGRSEQISFKNYLGAESDFYADVVRVYPDPPKVFVSSRIPRTLTQSLTEADRSLQAGANIAACVMLGRALEALCRDLLAPQIRDASDSTPENEPREEVRSRAKRIMLNAGIKELRDRTIIDDRLYDWSISLNAVRNLAAHPEDITVSRQDAEDLQAFVYAITEYVYDLSDRYNQFKEREDEKISINESFKKVLAGTALPQPK
ncbi:DUF4145 domain-containing protein [Rhodopseudomonas sp. HC1]|uniref:DUF4145 domain-containing protein n=1 Tax=Rhodopseudomonas infernalis TaxID=2897386 RepID=UPI001EE863E3|nr:DUF4145 domain-containing protein [Rhodopseudomonas infernalis]MCG6207135.1 DUF4145 domain-containing protein [Rhodopseudomonas infernalis]